LIAQDGIYAAMWREQQQAAKRAELAEGNETGGSETSAPA